MITLVNAEIIKQNQTTTYKVYLPEYEQVYFTSWNKKTAKQRCTEYLEIRGFKLSTKASFSVPC